MTAPGSFRSVVVGVDVGGTYTDAAVIDRGRLVTAKTPTTPHDQSEGVIAAIEAALASAEASNNDVTRFVHGMTVGTNALLEGELAPTALLATAGFTDIEELGRQARAHLYRLCMAHPPPIVPAERRHPVHERCGPDGVIVELDEVALRQTIESLDRDLEAVAVCLLWGFRHQGAERRTAALIEELRPDLHVSTSHETAGVFREYERFSTTVVDAALSPLLRAYLDRLRGRVEDAGLPPPEVMLSGGGVAAAEIAARHGSWTVLSGPAGGAVGAAVLAASAGSPDAVCLDMGGTSCDVSLASGGGVRLAGSGAVGGRPLALPMVDVHTVGAGGGSIAWRDSGGALRVGPRSAGSIPGPACYGRGGTQPTVTDANLVLGRLDPRSPLAGSVALDRRAAERAVDSLAGLLGIERLAAAAGIVRVASAQMARAVRVMTVDRGIDPRGLALLAFGGAGPLHAAQIAGELGIGRVLVPQSAGVLSAVGLIASERRRDLAESVLLSGDALTGPTIASVVERLAERGGRDLATSDGEVRASFDLRYAGQAFELSVTGAAEPDPAQLREAFDRAHFDRYGYADAAAQLELVTVRVAVALPAPELPATPHAEAERLPERRVHFDSGPVDAAAVRGMPPELAGPAVVELAESTLVVPPGWRCGRSDDGASIVMER